MTQKLHFYDLVQGMSQELPAHLPAERVWWETYNVKFRNSKMTQALLYDQLLALDTSATDETQFTSLTPYSASNYRSLVAAISGKALYLVDFANNEGIPFAHAGALEDSSGERWCTLTRAGILYYTSKGNGLFKFDGTGTVTTSVVTTGPTISPRYIEEFFDHLVTANNLEDSIDYPLRVRFSDLGQYGEFEPTTTNEADFFDLSNNELNNLFGLGITGLKKLGDVCVVYTSGSIWHVRYTGFDNGVWDLRENIQGIGCAYPHGLVGIDKYHFFPAADDFYMYDGVQCISIGAPIREAFYADVTTEPTMKSKLWAYIDIPAQEVKWFYPSVNSTGGCDKCLVFSWTSRSWYFENGNDRTALLTKGITSYRWIDRLAAVSTTIDGLAAVSDTIDGLAQVEVVPYNVSLATDNFYLWKDRTADLWAFNVHQLCEATLITRDLVIGERDEVKTVLAVQVDATHTELTVDPDYRQTGIGDQSGWEVYCSVRDNIGDAVSYDFLGLYPNLEYSSPGGFSPVATGLPSNSSLISVARAGRIFRFKFVSRRITNAQFYGFTLILDAGSSEN